jgi:hypothetical protein
MLDELLKYHHEPEPGNFTREVMSKVGKGNRTRSMILWCSGIIGAGVGTGGVLLSQESFPVVLDKLVAQGPLGTPVIAMAVVLVLFCWFLNEAIE